MSEPGDVLRAIPVALGVAVDGLDCCANVPADVLPGTPAFDNAG